MTVSSRNNRADLLQLMADLATEGHAHQSREEIEMRLDAPSARELQGMELAAAAAHLACLPAATATLPGPLRDRILTDAGRFFGAHGIDAPAAENLRLWASRSRRGSEMSVRRSAPYFLAAASILLAVAGWWRSPVSHAPSDVSIQRQYQALTAQASDLLRAPWTIHQKDYRGAAGEVVWSSARQQGFMRFIGMTPNDPAVDQYQLWIIDPARDKHPVDGGVFNVDSTGEVVLPIEAKLLIVRPTAFAITREQPGGVVVSDGPLLLVGSVSG